jgi:Trypsin-like peptidase domain
MIGPTLGTLYPEIGESDLRIDDYFKDSAFYIYKSAADARRGEAEGGTGFLVVVQHKTNKRYGVLYAVTNAHIIRAFNTPTFRLNTPSGQIATESTRRSDWTLHPDGDDIAVIPVQGYEKYQIRAIPEHLFLNREFLHEYGYGVGDEVFMVGRFVGHEGRKRNLPSVRFGNISMVPEEPVRHGSEEHEAFLIELRSVGGYSGSPVFIWWPITGAGQSKTAFLLGIDCGHIQTTEPIHTKGGSKLGFVRFNSAMAVVSPVWRIRELLYKPSLIRDREIEDALITERKGVGNFSVDYYKQLTRSASRR